MLPKCLVFSDINIFIRTYSSGFLGVFATSILGSGIVGTWRSPGRAVLALYYSRPHHRWESQEEDSEPVPGLSVLLRPL